MTDTKAITYSVPLRVRKSIYPFKGNANNSWAVTWKNTIIVGDYEDSSVIHYHHHSGEWIRQEIRGDIPRRGEFYIAQVLKDKIILIQAGFDNTMYSLTPETWICRRLRPRGTPKVAFSGKAFWIYSGKMYFFGGVDTHHQVLNRLWCYNPATNVWKVKAQSGDIPSPRYANCATIDNEGTVFLFGGKEVYGTEYMDEEMVEEMDDRVNDLFMFDMRTFQWKKIHGSSAWSNGGRVMPLRNGYPLFFTIISHSTAFFASHRDADLPFECWHLDLNLAKQVEAPSRIWTQIPNDFQQSPVSCLPVREPLSGSLWLIGLYDGLVRPCLYTPDILKISPHKLSLKELALDYIVRNMRTDRLLTDPQIPMELKNDIKMHKLKI